MRQMTKRCGAYRLNHVAPSMLCPPHITYLVWHWLSLRDRLIIHVDRILWPTSSAQTCSDNMSRCLNVQPGHSYQTDLETRAAQKLKDKKLVVSVSWNRAIIGGLSQTEIQKPALIRQGTQFDMQLFCSAGSEVKKTATKRLLSLPAQLPAGAYWWAKLQWAQDKFTTKALILMERLKSWR